MSLNLADQSDRSELGRIASPLSPLASGPNRLVDSSRQSQGLRSEVDPGDHGQAHCSNQVEGTMYFIDNLGSEVREENC